MNLLAYQIRLLKEEYEKNVAERNNRQVAVSDNTIGFKEMFSDDEVQVLNKNLERNINIYSLLTTSNVITTYSEDNVAVGTTFTVAYIDDITEEEVCTLIEQRVSTESVNDGFVTLDTLFGASVHRKKAGETFAYETPNGLLVSGIVTSIYTKEEQMEFFKTLEENNKIKKLRK